MAKPKRAQARSLELSSKTFCATVRAECEYSNENLPGAPGELVLRSGGAWEMDHADFTGASASGCPPRPRGAPPLSL
eukprot:10210601-Alexandrium_andersonii.AAC.1